jgi:hypothetical protein
LLSPARIGVHWTALSDLGLATALPFHAKTQTAWPDMLPEVLKEINAAGREGSRVIREEINLLLSHLS